MGKTSCCCYSTMSLCSYIWGRHPVVVIPQCLCTYRWGRHPVVVSPHCLCARTDGEDIPLLLFHIVSVYLQIWKTSRCCYSTLSLCAYRWERHPVVVIPHYYCVLTDGEDIPLLLFHIVSVYLQIWKTSRCCYSTLSLCAYRWERHPVVVIPHYHCVLIDGEDIPLLLLHIVSVRVQMGKTSRCCYSTLSLCTYRFGRHPIVVTPHCLCALTDGKDILLLLFHIITVYL